MVIALLLNCARLHVIICKVICTKSVQSHRTLLYSVCLWAALGHHHALSS